jgi:hypothetical protein
MHFSPYYLLLAYMDVYEIFRQDFASTTTNLEGILHIADEYKIETLNGALLASGCL